MSDKKDTKDPVSPAPPKADPPEANAETVKAADGEATKPEAEAKVDAVPADEAKTQPNTAVLPPDEAKTQPYPAAPPTDADDVPAPKPRKAEVKTPEPGVRVRIAYMDGSSVDAPEGKGRLAPRRLLAEYESTADIIHAAETLRDAGYKAFEAHTPFPIHGMDAAMGLEDSKLGWIVLACGLTGVSCAWIMMFWMNGVDYPLVIGGKPPGALPSMVPIMFELTVLLSSFGAVLGMFGLNRLPQHHDLLFYSDRFAAFSNDRFFLSVESQDPKFDLKKTQALLEKTHPEVIEVIETTEVES